MKCKKAERLLLRFFDGLLKPEENSELNIHLKSCHLCRTKREEYQGILNVLKKVDFPEHKPYFWERLQPKLKDRKKYRLWPLWKQWGIRAVPLSLFIVALLVSVIVFFLPQKPEELSQSEILLLRNLNPFQETRALFEVEKFEDKNMMLIFTFLEENNSQRRYFP